VERRRKRKTKGNASERRCIKKDKVLHQKKRKKEKEPTTAVNIRRGLTSSWPSFFSFLVNVRETLATNEKVKREREGKKEKNEIKREVEKLTHRAHFPFSRRV
jgi:phosphopantetheine adenylyltransferase